ncbi:hypothetical protein Tco_0643975 [Tanacetum coccineum]
MVQEGALTTLAAIANSSQVLNILISSNVAAIQDLILFQIERCEAGLERMRNNKISPLGHMGPNFALMLARDLPEIVQTGYHLIPHFIFNADKDTLKFKHKRERPSHQDQRITTIKLNRPFIASMQAQFKLIVGSRPTTERDEGAS